MLTKTKNQLFDMGIKPGVYFDMPDTEYHKIPALSSSGIKNLLISPMDFWARSWMNPRYEHPESSAMKLGTAYHKRILEGKKAFDNIYAPEFDPTDYPDALKTVQDLKKILADLGMKTTGKKEFLIQMLLEVAPETVVLDVQKGIYEGENSKKIFLPKDEMNNIEYAAAFIEKHPQISQLFTGGKAEVSIFWYDESGVPLKSRIDYLKPKAIIDLKTFTNRLQKPIDLAIHNEIASRRYHLQAAMYSKAAEQFKIEHFYNDKEFIFVFQQTGVAPICSAKRFSKSLLTFDNGLSAVKSAIRMFHLCYTTFGKEPWLTEYGITSLDDDCFPAFIVEV